MKNSIPKCFYAFWLCLLMLMFWPMISGSSVAFGQYYTTVSTGQLNKTAYAVERYASMVPELQKKITLKKEQVPRKDILDEIAAKADLGIAYNPQLAVLRSKISLNLQSVTVARALQEVLSKTEFQAALSRTREIVLQRRPISRTLPLVSLEQEISGTVTDAETGDPLPAVNVQAVGTTIGTSTDTDGSYNLSVPDDTDSLRFSYIGYQTKTVAISNRNTINVALGREVRAFDEMVVTALGISREERSVGYSTQKVEGENLSFTKEQNVIGSLAGKIAGVNVSGSSGASMGGTQTIKIRGINSLSGEGQPLIVVDGTPISNGNFSASEGKDFGNLAQDINPSDIKSVNVLKGPAASALYGIRGQYGVVMITTKDGSEIQDFQVQVNSSFSLQRAKNFMNYQNKYGGGYQQEWMTFPNGDKYVEAWADESWGPRMDGTMVREMSSLYPQDPNYGELTPFSPRPDNIKNFFETGFKSNQNISISGGGKNSNYRLSFNDTRISGVVPRTKLSRNNLGISADFDVSEKWTFSTNLNYATNSGRRPSQGYAEGGSRHFRQWFQRHVNMNELKDYKYPDGTIKHWNIRNFGQGKTPEPAYWSNPYFMVNESPTLDGRNRIFGNIGAEFNAMPGLTLSAYVRGDTYTQNIESKTAAGGVQTPGYSVEKIESREMNYELKAQYTKNWDNFSLDATLGTNVFHETYSSVSQSTVGGLTSPGYFNIDASVDRPDNDSYKEEKKILSAYGLVSLGYNDTYYLDLSLRNDKTSTLPEDNNSYLYPSISGSFVFSELIDWEPLSFGKIRASYAQAGSDLSPYQTSVVYTVGTKYDDTNTLSVPNNLNNPNIKPSFSNSYEAGIDLNLFGRLEMSFTYYLQRNKNQIIALDVSGTSGYSSATINAGLIENRGIELSLSGTPVQTQVFSWNSTFNFGRNRNEVVRLHPDIDVYTHGSHTYSGVNSYMNSYEGRAYGRLVGQAYKRDPETGKILLDQNNMPMWTEATHDFGSVLPDFTGGFQNIFHYNRFTLSTMISFQAGGQFFSWSRMLSAKTGMLGRTAAVNDKGHNVRDPISEGGGVKVEGISNATGKPVTAYVDAETYYNEVVGVEIYEEWVTDASYINLKEVALGYTFSNKILEGIPVKSVRLSAYVNNPVMIWQEAPQGLDPSALSSGSQDITWTETGQLNSVRTFGMNLNLTF